MADRAQSLPENLPGPFFVDATCIDCDTCRQLAPATFGETGEYSFVKLQPRTPQEERAALRALIACPTGSIGGGTTNGVRDAAGDFPMKLDGGVYYCGFNSRKSFGGNSYFVQYPDGNWLVDSPRFVEHLASRFAALGGIRYIFLTHRDDVADAEKYAARFSATRIFALRARGFAAISASLGQITLRVSTFTTPPLASRRNSCLTMRSSRE